VWRERMEQQSDWDGREWKIAIICICLSIKSWEIQS
jgi:hypothetical protein